ncbi:LysR family transcriptional regulator [Lichenicoccus sp.]|uniref:LysR family transcriptional regulator n=1 Tax=Lichenicoccus sp. TaxID=2781899 RepID=UPI003D152C1B
MIQTNDLGGLRAFVTVAELASFSRAAEGLGVSSSALSQTIRGLEERVGTRLLHRTTRSVSPTEAGAALLSQVRPALAALESAFDHARRAGRGPSGTVRVHCFRAAADLFIAPILASFHEAYPDIVLDLTVDDAVVDLVQGGFDIGVRVAELIERDMVAVRLGGEMRQIAVASPTYIAAHGTPQTPQDLLRHRCIRWRWPGQTTPYAWEFHESGRWFSIVVEGPLIASSRELGLRAALDGVGIAFVRTDSVAGEIAQGRLLPLLERWSAPFAGFFLCYPQQRHMAPAVRAFIDELRRANGNTRDADL